MPVYFPPGGDSDYIISGQNVFGNGIVYSVSPTGDGNVALGPGIMADLTNAFYCIGIGENALNAQAEGSDNIGIGHNSLPVLVSGFDNIAIGGQSMWLADNDNCEYNIGIGYSSLESMTNGAGNVALGYKAGSGLDEFNPGVLPINNIAIGYKAGENYSGGGEGNIFIGAESVGFTGDSDHNIVLGYQAGGTSSADILRNVIIGYNAASASIAVNSDIEDDNVFIGPNTYSTNPAQNTTHSTALGADAFVTKSNQMKLGTVNDVVSLPGALEIDEAAPNPIMGQATLVAGAVTISTSKVTANSRIFLSHHTANHASANVDIQNIVPGVSFDIVSTNGTDTSVINWLLIEPS